MTTEEIISKWKELEMKTNPLTSQDINSFGLGELTLSFLTQCGFPKSAAPFLSFVDNSGFELRTINRLTNLYELSDRFDGYISIGADGAGNAIVVDTNSNDIIELLDHDQGFTTICYMNENVLCLSACLIAYRCFITTIRESNGPHAFLENDFTDQQFDDLKQSLSIADKGATVSGFWASELEGLILGRDARTT